MKKFSIIVAIEKNYGLGKNNTLVWKLSQDLAHFKQVTTSSDSNKINAVVMGFNTWESLPKKSKPLPKRQNVVLSLNPFPYQLPDSVLGFHDFNQALLTLSQDSKIQEIFIIGGAQIYKIAINHPQCEKLYLTRIFNSFDCDTYFEKFEHKFQLVKESAKQRENNISFTFQTWVKI